MKRKSFFQVLKDNILKEYYMSIWFNLENKRPKQKPKLCLLGS